MKRAGIVLALLIIAIGAWIDLPSEEQLNAMSPDQLAGIRSNLVTGCGRADELKSNLIVRYFRGKQLKTLSDRCELIKARLGSVEGP
jgi:hypothetical protein